MNHPTTDLSDTVCPGCETDQLSALFEEVSAVCDGCGLVIYDIDDPDIPDFSIENKGEDSNDTLWSDVRPAYNSTQHRISDAIQTIEEVSDDLSIPTEVRYSAAKLYVEAAISGIVAGRSITAAAAGTLYLSCRRAGDSRPIKRIASTADIDTTELRNVIESLRNGFPLDGASDTSHGEPESFLAFLCLDLELGSEIVSRSTALLRDIGGECSFSGKHPVAIAAAAVYLSADDPPSQRELAEAAGVATETVRKRLREFREAESGLDG